MPWVWSDELAARLLQAGIVESDGVDRWTLRPVAFSVDDPEDILVLGRRLLGLETREDIAS